MTDGRHDGTPERLVDAKEAARVLGLGERTVRRRIATGEIPSIKSGTRRLVPLSAIDTARRRATAGVPDTVPSGMPPTTPSEAPAWLALVDRIARLERENGMLSTELKQARAELEKLRALPSAGRGPVAVPEPVLLHKERATTAPRPWWHWRRLLGIP